MERTNRIKLIPSITLEQWLKMDKVLYQDPYHKDVRYSQAEVRACLDSRKVKNKS